ncbi:MAG: 16S rRNA (cytidine(1402)-2'-O)-methyltransferase [Caldimicrobium sp.]
MVTGCLYVVALPIGNLKDITLRAIEVLRDVEVVLTEDTRSFKKLEKAYNLNSKKLISFYKEVECSKEEEIISWLKAGKKVALCSEAGTPLLSDPGGSLIRRVYKEGIKVVPIPGASSLTTALSVSPIDLSQGFIFLGFLPRRESDIKARLEKIPPEMPFILFIPPHRFKRTLSILLKYLGDRECFLARELTKFHEELLPTKLSSLALRENIKGEITLIVAQATETENLKEVINLEKIKEEILKLKKLKLKPKEIVKFLGKKYKISSKDLYNYLNKFKD